MPSRAEPRLRLGKALSLYITDIRGNSCRIEGNHLASNTNGITTDSIGNLIVRNDVCGTTGKTYDIAIGNHVGKIITPAANTTKISGPSGGGLDNTNAALTSPWANFAR